MPHVQDISISHNIVERYRFRFNSPTVADYVLEGDQLKDNGPHHEALIMNSLLGDPKRLGNTFTPY